MSSESKINYDLKRFAGIKRDYKPEKSNIQSASSSRKNYGIY